MIFQSLVLIVLAVCGGQGVEDAEWQKVAPDGAGFEVLMPNAPKIVARKVTPLPDHPITVNLASTTINQGKALFMVAYHDLDFDATSDDKIRDVLDGGIKGSLLNALGKLSKHTRINLGEHPGRHFEYAGNRFNQKIKAISRIFLVGRRVYQVTVIHSPDVDVTAETTKFFDSFKLVAAAAAAPVDPFSSGDKAPPKSAPAEKPKTDGGK